MNSINQEDGAIFIDDTKGGLLQVGSISHGISMSLIKDTSCEDITTVCIYHKESTDRFYFDNRAGSPPVFHYIQTDLPELRWTYLQYFNQASTYSPSGLMKYVIKHYFMKQLGRIPQKLQE